MNTPEYQQKIAEWNSTALDTILHKVSKIDTLVTVQTRQETMLEKLTEAVSKLAIIEERQNNDRNTLERAFGNITVMGEKHDLSMSRIADMVEKVEGRVDALERSESLNKQMRVWVFGAIGAVGLAVLYAVLSLIGLNH